VARVRRNTIGVVGAVIIAATGLVAFIGPLVWRADYADQAARRLLAPSAIHPLGTDELGRDEMSRIIHGAQVSLQVGMISVIIALAFGTITGVTAGFYGRTVDAVLMRGVDIMFAFPGLVLAIVIAGLLGPSRTNAMIAIGIVYAPAFARVVRGSTLSVLSLPYVEAARSLGLSDLRIVVRHLLPNILAPLIVLTTVYLSTAILTEAALSFLGLGTQPPEPSWGGMLNASRSYMERAPWLAIAPGMAIMVVVLGFNFLGDGLRDILDPQLRDA
jgi:peptide/nickel transport system permease protein